MGARHGGHRWPDDLGEDAVARLLGLPDFQHLEAVVRHSAHVQQQTVGPVGAAPAYLRAQGVVELGRCRNLHDEPMGHGELRSRLRPARWSHRTRMSVPYERCGVTLSSLIVTV